MNCRLPASVPVRVKNRFLPLENDANVHAKNDEALRYASRYGHFEVVKLLLEAGANKQIAAEAA